MLTLISLHLLTKLCFGTQYWVQTKTEWVLDDPAVTHLDFRQQNLKKPVFSVGNFVLNAICNF